MKKFLSLILTLAMILSLVTVPAMANDPEPVAVTSVTLNKASATLYVGDTETLTATVAPENATDKTVTWSSSSDAVATVAGGVVTAVAAGTATITVATADQSKTATCTVTVKDKYELTVSADKTTLYYNGTDAYKTATLTATLTKNGYVQTETTDYTVEVKESSDKLETTGKTVSVASSVAAAESNITVTVDAKVGDSTVATKTVAISVDDRYSIDVVPAADKTVAVTKGNTKTLTAPVLKDALSAYPVSSSGYTLAYACVNTTIAGVNETSGVVTGKTVGDTTATATITYGSKEYKVNYNIKVNPITLAIKLDEVENGDDDYLYASDLKSAVVSALETAVPSYTGNETVTSLKVTANTATGGKLYKQDGTTAITSTDNLVDSAISYTRFDATVGYLGNVTYAVTVVIDSETYTGTMVVPVAADYANFAEEVEATETTGGWEFYVPSGYDYLFYTKTLPTSDYDGYFTSSNTPSGWTKVSTSKTLTSSEFNSSGECKLYVVLLDDGVASTGTLTVTQVFGGIEYSGEVGDEIYFDEDDFVDYIEDFSSVYSASLTDVKFTNVKSVSSNVTLYNNGSKITDNTTKCTNLDKVYATATKAGTYDFNFTATANTKSSSSATEKKDQTFTGVVRVTVYKDGDIEYEVDANKSVNFDEDDFDEFYTKDDLSYVVFGTPSAGTLYENTRCTIKADTTTKYYFEATGSQDDLDDVTFEADKTPLTEYSVYIPFTAYAKNGTKSMDGVVEIVVNGSLPFTDVLESNTFYSYIKYCYRENIMQGKTTTLFKPAEPVTRAQFITTLYRMANSPTTYNSNTMSFTDCKNLSTEFQNAIKWGVAKKLINGYGNTFKPGNSITRQAMVTILYRFGVNLGYIDGYDVVGNLNVFSDAAKISSDMQEAVKWAVGMGLVSGSNGKFNPTGTTTRGACAKVLAGFHETYIG